MKFIDVIIFAPGHQSLMTKKPKPLLHIRSKTNIEARANAKYSAV